MDNQETGLKKPGSKLLHEEGLYRRSINYVSMRGRNKFLCIEPLCIFLDLFVTEADISLIYTLI